MNSSMLKSVHISRGLAALAVVFYHVDLIFGQKLGDVAFGALSKYGYLGVPYFFVLSGFIITVAHGRDVGSPGSLSPYLGKRFLRVYPVYWVYSALFIIASVLGFGEPDFSWDPVHLAEAFGLVHLTPEFSSPPLKVAWTLFYEVRFYILFALMIFSPRIGVAVGLAWLAAIAFLSPVNAFSAELLSYWNCAFLFGAIAALGFQRFEASWWWLPTSLGLTLVACVLTSTDVLALDRSSFFVLPISLGFALIVAGGAQFERHRGLICGKLGMLLGNASYSIYLVHSAVISVAAIIVRKWAVLKHAPLEAMFFIVAFAAVAAGLLAYRWVEQPLLNFLKTRPKGGVSFAGKTG